MAENETGEVLIFILVLLGYFFFLFPSDNNLCPQSVSCSSFPDRVAARARGGGGGGGENLSITLRLFSIFFSVVQRSSFATFDVICIVD